MVNLTGKIGQKVLLQRAGGDEMPDEKKDPERYKKWLEMKKEEERVNKLPLAMRRMNLHLAQKRAILAYEKNLAAQRRAKAKKTGKGAGKKSPRRSSGRK